MRDFQEQCQFVFRATVRLSLFFFSYHLNGCTEFCYCWFFFSTISIVIRQPCKDDEISVTVELTGFYCTLRFPWNWMFKKFITIFFFFAAQAWILLVIVAALPFMMMKMTRCLVARLRWQTRKGLRSVWLWTLPPLPRNDQSQNFTKFPNLILLYNENQITAYENTEEVSFE